MDRHSLDRAAGLLSFDQLASYSPPRRLQVLWIENSLDCRMWSYYCDIRKAMAELHDLCTPRGATICLGTSKFVPDVAVVGPRYSINIGSEDDSVGFDRSLYANVPLLVMQNKMYTPQGWKEIVGNATAKLAWARAAGATAAFTWLTRHREFTRLSGVPHHWLPFGVDMGIFGANAGKFGAEAQPFDVGFTGASGKDKYPLRAEVLQALQSMKNVSGYYGTWAQTALNRADPRSWKAGNHDTYALQMSKARIWLSTLGPSNIVGTRYFEVIASGTTLLMCNRPRKATSASSATSTWIYDGLFEDGVHVVMFEDAADLQAKVRRYLRDEPARRRIVQNAHALAQKIHSWGSRARFISRVAEQAIESARAFPAKAPQYVPPRDALFANHSSYVGCYMRRDKTEIGLLEPPRSRNKRKLWRYTVASCQAACKNRWGRAAYAALLGGGFATGNGHTLARCMCAARGASTGAPLPGWERQSDLHCATTCSLHDNRPCGGHREHAFFRIGI